MAKRFGGASLPLLVLFGIGVFILAGLQLADLVMQVYREVTEERTEDATTARPSNNTFRNLANVHPKSQVLAERLRQKIPQPLTTSMPVSPHNITLGPFDAAARLTIFTDPSCAPCREQVAQVLNGVDTSTVHVVFKFMPVDARDYHGGDQTGGIFQQLARVYGVWDTLAREMAVSRRDWTEEDWVNALADTGKPLRTVRADLREQMPVIMRNLEQDRALAELALVQTVPAFFINNYFIDGQMLTLGTLGRSISRLQRGEPILNVSDLPGMNQARPEFQFGR